MTETKIYVGLNDSVTRTQLFDTEKYINILRKVCCSYGMPFSFGLEEGGYIYEDGEYSRETTLVLTLIDADRNAVSEIAGDLCAFFRQESVLITENPVRTYYISETLAPQAGQTETDKRK